MGEVQMVNGFTFAVSPFWWERLIKDPKKYKGIGTKAT